MNLDWAAEVLGYIVLLAGALVVAGAVLCWAAIRVTDSVTYLFNLRALIHRAALLIRDERRARARKEKP